MVWALKFDGVDDHLTFTQVNRSETTWRIEFKLKNNIETNGFNNRILGRTQDVNDSIYIALSAGNDRIGYRVDGTTHEITHNARITSASTYHTYRIEANGTQLEMFIDGTSIGTIAGSPVFKDFNAFCRNSTSYAGVDLEYFRYYDTSAGDTLIYDWDATASSHAAGTPVLTESVSSNHATAVNMLTDGTAWEDLGGTDFVLSNATATASGQTTANISVDTDTASGLIYYYASINASESEATIKASGASDVPESTGTQNYVLTDLTAGTSYYAHFYQEATGPLVSNVISSAQFTTDAITRAIVDIDTDNNVRAGQTNVVITTTDLDASPTVQTATLGGESLSIVSWSATSVTVDIPTSINLKWGELYTLQLTDDTGPVTLGSVTLSAQSGWGSVIFDGTIPDAGATESFYEYAQADADVGNFLMAAGDQLAWESDAALTIDSQTIPTVNPPQTVTGQYKIWDDSAGAWTGLSTYTISDVDGSITITNVSNFIPGQTVTLTTTGVDLTTATSISVTYNSVVQADTVATASNTCDFTLDADGHEVGASANLQISITV